MLRYTSTSPTPALFARSSSRPGILSRFTIPRSIRTKLCLPGQQHEMKQTECKKYVTNKIPGQIQISFYPFFSYWRWVVLAATSPAQNIAKNSMSAKAWLQKPAQALFMMPFVLNLYLLSKAWWFHFNICKISLFLCLNFILDSLFRWSDGVGWELMFHPL